MGRTSERGRGGWYGSLTSTISQSYGYDVAGRLYTVTRGAYSVWYDYHPNSRLVSKTTGRYNGMETMRTERQHDTMNRLRDIRSSMAAPRRFPPAAPTPTTEPISAPGMTWQTAPIGNTSATRSGR